jgi:hypothetical protein
MKIHRSLQKLLVGTHKTGWKFDKPSFIFGKQANNNHKRDDVLSPKRAAALHSRSCNCRRRPPSVGERLLLKEEFTLCFFPNFLTAPTKCAMSYVFTLRVVNLLDSAVSCVAGMG